MAVIVMLFALCCTSALSCARQTVQAARQSWRHVSGKLRNRRAQPALPPANVVKLPSSWEATGTLLVLLVLFAPSCAHSAAAPPPAKCETSAEPLAGPQMIHTPDGFIVRLVYTSNEVTITNITAPSGRSLRFEYDSNSQPTRIQLFDHSIMERQDDGTWYHYSPPGWWPRALPYTATRSAEGTVTIVTPAAIVTLGLNGIRVKNRTP